MFLRISLHDSLYPETPAPVFARLFVKTRFFGRVLRQGVVASRIRTWTPDSQKMSPAALSDPRYAGRNVRPNHRGGRTLIEIPVPGLKPKDRSVTGLVLIGKIEMHEPFIH